MNAQRRFRSVLLFVALFACGLPADAKTPRAASASDSPQLTALVDGLMRDNGRFAWSVETPLFKQRLDQPPRATVVTCAVALFSSDEPSTAPESDVYVVRTVGKRLTGADASVAYGVRRLHTPLLIFVGHPSCVTATANRRVAGRRTVRLSAMEAARTAVDRQVASAMKTFRREIAGGELTVIGTVYDMTNMGATGLELVNVNGDTNRTGFAVRRMRPIPAIKPEPVAKPKEPPAPRFAPPPYSYP